MTGEKPAVASREGALAHRAREATGDWLWSAFTWDVFITLTFSADAVSLRLAARRFKSFARRLAAKRLRRHVRIAWFVDLQRRGVPHFHVLLGALDEDPRRVELADMDGLWRWGDALARPYDGRGAAFYGLRGHRHWDINVACPRPAACRRPKGCLFAPGPWPTPGGLTL